MEVGSVLQQTLERLRVEHGPLTAELLVEQATDPLSPLHQYFSWDDRAAAHQYRLFQARALIRRVRIRVETQPDKFIKVRAYTHVKRENAYVPTAQALERHGEVVLAQARRELRALRTKYDSLVDFGQLLRDELERLGSEQKEVQGAVQDLEQ